MNNSAPEAMIHNPWEFLVTGPDGKLYRAKSKREALSNLLARLRTWETQPWRIQVDQ